MNFVILLDEFPGTQKPFEIWISVKTMNKIAHFFSSDIVHFTLTRGVTVNVLENGCSDPSSNPG